MCHTPDKNQRGMAMFIVVMTLSLGSAIALLAFQVTSTELAIARYSKSEVTAQYLAESGVEKVLSWAMTPKHAPQPSFFSALTEKKCTGSKDRPDFPKSDFSAFTDLLKNSEDSGPFSTLKNQGHIIDLRLYAPTHLTEGLCTLEVTAETQEKAKAKVRVNIALNPLGQITAGIQGAGHPGTPSPTWAHWGKVRYTGDVNLGTTILNAPRLDVSAFPTGEPYALRLEDPFMTLEVQNKILNPPPDNINSYLARPNITQNNGTDAALDPIHSARLKSFIKKHGAYYTVSEDGQHLLQNGHHILDKEGNHIDRFDDIFNGKTQKSALVWIDNKTSPPLKIAGGKFRGYFYFTGSIVIQGNAPGREVTAQSPPVDAYPEGLEVPLANINLEGLFAAKNTIDLLDRFTTYGAIYSAKGFKGPGATQLEVWYNRRFSQSIYPGVRTVTPLIGTWVSVPIDGS